MRRLALLLTLVLAACAARPTLAPPPPVAQLDFARFTGKWYVIANIPNSAERGKVGAWVEYSDMRDEDSFLEHYNAWSKDFSGTAQHDEREAWIVDDQTHAQWKVKSGWPDRVIAYVDPDYQHALMTHASRDYVWVLARQRYLGDDVYNALVARLSQLGYDTTRVLKVPQRPEFIGAPGFQ